MRRDAVWYESDNPNGFRTGQRLSVDTPCVTVMAEGLGGDSLGHWHLIWTGGQMLAASAEPGKPSYRVPSMAEIAEIPWNGYTVASTFSGAGGSCLGYRMAGYRVVWASEFVPIAAESYRANAPDTVLDTRDIRTVTAAEILEATGLEVGQLDLLDGSPPCQPFSTAGKREKTWGKQRDYGDHSQRADDLFFEYARLVRDLQPRTFVAENVSGLVKGTAKGYFKEILAALKACGYQVEARLLDAQWLGVPQMRQRIIFMGVRSDLGIAPVFPKPLSYRYSVRDALPWISAGKYGAEWRPSDSESPTVSATLAYNSATNHQGLELVEIEDGYGAQSVDGPAAVLGSSRPVRLQTGGRDTRDHRGAYGNSGEITDQPSPAVLSGSVGTHWIEEPRLGTSRGERSIDEPAPTVLSHGREHTTSELTMMLPPSRSRAYDGQSVDGLTIVDPEQPSPTVTIGSAGNDIAPPTERRKFSIAELRRICAFPDDFILCGSYAEQWARLGNAVPPLMMRAVAETIRDKILEPRRG
jgi:DNA (cytosine-5)-methyltransferase 1